MEVKQLKQLRQQLRDPPVLMQQPRDVHILLRRTIQTPARLPLSLSKGGCHSKHS